MLTKSNCEPPSPECVRNNQESGIDILTDGEQSKPGFFSYMSRSVGGFRTPPELRSEKFAAEVVPAFPEYYEQYFKRAMLGGAVVPSVPLVCTGPIRYRGDEALRRDIDNLKAATANVKCHAVFMPSVAPSGVGTNEYYRSDEEFFHAVGAALRTEYQAIVDAGFLLQIDDPFLSENFGDPSLDGAQRAPGPRSTSKPSMRVCVGYRRNGCACTHATASTRGRGYTKQRWRMSRVTCCE